MLVVVGQALVLDDLLDLVLAVGVVDFMREIARKDERLVPDRLDRLVQGRLGPFTADEYSSRLDVPPDIRAHFFARLELDVLSPRIVLDMGLPAAVEPLDTGLQPRNARLHEADAQIGE